MHNAQAQLRAIESGRYVVRAANTGISTVLSDRGEILCDLEPLVDGMLVEDVALREDSTLYTGIGNLPVYLCGLALLTVIAEDMIRRIRHRVGRRARNLDRD
jgi:apolipoprotein N-acyltransferase